MPTVLVQSKGDFCRHLMATRRPAFRQRLSRRSMMSRLLFTFISIGLWGVPSPCRAVSVVSGPSFIAAAHAPLAGILQLTTDVDTRVSVSVNDGTQVWERRLYDFGTAHAIPLFGFKPGRTNLITVTVLDRYRQSATVSQPLVFVTTPLPGDFPNITLAATDRSRMEPGYTLFRVGVDARVGVNSNTYAYIVIVDSSGDVVWYDRTAAPADLRRLDNGNLFMPLAQGFGEVNLLGETVQTWNAPTNGVPVDPHEGLPTPHGTILYLNDSLESVTEFPTSATDPNARLETSNVFYQRVVELSQTNSAILNTWSPIDVMDPRRISYLFGIAPVGTVGSGWDTEHSNAIIEDPSDDSIIVSMRDQNAIVKFSRATGQLRWILGPHDNWGPKWQPYLLTPTGAPFAWQYAQHAPIITSRGTLILYDNGNFRASPFAPPLPDSRNYSRAVEYAINEQTMEVTQVWQYGSTNVGEWFYTGYEGNAEPQPTTGNILVNFSAVSYADGTPPSPLYPQSTMAHLREVTHEPVPQVVFDLEISMYNNTNTPYRDCTVYRAHRIPDLYGHPAAAVADLSVTLSNGVAQLQFSGDDTRRYALESSTDLLNWEAIGIPSEDQQRTGEFQFQDTPTPQGAARYYRVLTE
jgi:arylsulfate sulfotransferase